jgi:hypothetical protein
LFVFGADSLFALKLLQTEFTRQFLGHFASLSANTPTTGLCRSNSFQLTF